MEFLFFRALTVIAIDLGKFGNPDKEFEALKNLSANCNLIIQKADKGNSVVLVEKDACIRGNSMKRSTWMWKSNFVQNIDNLVIIGDIQEFILISFNFTKKDWADFFKIEYEG